MNLTLTNSRANLYGIFGTLEDEIGKVIAVTLQHAYADGSGFKPKVPDGVYKCVRGQHRLASMTNTFETFEITGVPGHTNILFHKGNTNNDSEGCVLLGQSFGTGCILESAIAFGEFLAAQEGCDHFELTINSITA